VEHVLVHSGGQAVVGVVETPGEGLSRNQRNNPVQLPMHRASKCRARSKKLILHRSRDSKSRLSRINDARRLRSSIASVVKPPVIPR
jgi:hypothetical protein